jgi:8-oxo-dGTP pyrophosphatase MutT (NUDIX family)
MAIERTIAPQAKPARLIPKDAATLVLLDRSGREARILMGRRRADLAFLANMFVFPGGRVDAADKTAPSSDELAAVQQAKLLIAMKGKASVSRARALAIAAVRETREETGIVFGGDRPPRLSALTFLARAITPPGRVRRYDTRFFLADGAAAASHALSGDGELGELAWFTLDETRGLELPGITRLVIEDIAEYLGDARSSSVRPVPFYYHRFGSFRRDLL